MNDDTYKWLSLGLGLLATYLAFRRAQPTTCTCAPAPNNNAALIAEGGTKCKGC